MSALLSSDPGLRGRFPKSAELPCITEDEAYAALVATLTGPQYNAALPREPPFSVAARGPSLQDILKGYFRRRRELRGDDYRNFAEVGTLATEINEAAMRRFSEAAKAATPPHSDEDHLQHTARVDAALQGLVKAWGDRGAVFLAEDIRSACNTLLQAAETDFAASLALQSSRALLGSRSRTPAAPAYASDTVSAPALEMRKDTATVMRTPLSSEPPVEASAVSLAPCWSLLGAGLNASFRRLGVASPGLYVDLLEGHAPESRLMLLTELREANARLPLSEQLGGSTLEDMLASLIAESKACLESYTDAFGSDMRAKRDQRRLVVDGTAAACALDVDMRKTCLRVVRTLHRICGICGRADSGTSGCAYRGFSPSPQETTT